MTSPEVLEDTGTGSMGRPNAIKPMQSYRKGVVTFQQPRGPKKPTRALNSLFAASITSRRPSQPNSTFVPADDEFAVEELGIYTLDFSRWNDSTYTLRQDEVAFILDIMSGSQMAIDSGTIFTHVTSGHEYHPPSGTTRLTVDEVNRLRCMFTVWLLMSYD